MQRVYFVPNPLDFATYEVHDVVDVRAFLMERYDTFPATARIYHKHVAQSCDVTPRSDSEIDKLATLDGPLWVVVYPGEPITIIIIVIAVLAVAAAFLLKPKIATPTPALRSHNVQNTSPNNELSARGNRPRVNGRIPDIFGAVRSTPDLLTSPYKLFIGHTEVEYAYMCIGRGTYDISDVRDDKTLVDAIAGASVEIYGPNTSPNSGVPQLTIGADIEQPLYHTLRSNSVDGQVLRAPNANKIIGALDIRFVFPDEVQLIAGSQKDFTAFFEPGDEVIITNAFFGSSSGGGTSNYTAYARMEIGSGFGVFRFLDFDPTTIPSPTTVEISNALFNILNGDGDVVNTVELSGSYDIYSVDTDEITIQLPQNINPQWSQLALYNGEDTPYEAGPRPITVTLPTITGGADYNLNGTYDVLSVESDVLTLADPADVNSDWNLLDGLIDDASPLASPTIVTSGPRWIGPFIMDSTTATHLFANFVALSGLYKDDGQNQIKTDVDIRLEVTPVDASGTPIGAAVNYDDTIEGSAQTRETRALSVIAVLPFVGRCSVRARRMSDTDLAFSGSVVDEIKWRDLYSANVAPETHFGNVTTVHAVTKATSGALSVKDRKLNMLVTRKLPQRVSGSTFTSTLHPTRSAADILSFVCLDPYIGNRQASEVDFDSVYDTVADVIAYFGIPEVGEFSYTFDSDNLSFEETVNMIATAIFCVAYRRGNVIRLSFERETDDSTLLFNHRNKLPGHETRTVRFGNQKDNDGVEYEYVDPDDDSIITFYLPADQSAVNPEKIESVGIRTHEQAHLQAWRLWNKIRYQNIGVEFTATQEADLAVLQDRILVADNTRPDTQDGEVMSQSGLILELSQPVNLSAGPYTIFLQHYDGTVQASAVSAGADDTHVVLTDAPTMPLALAESLYARTTYIIVRNSDNRATAFLVTEKKPETNFTFSITAVNYDSRYYQNDGDFL